MEDPIRRDPWAMAMFSGWALVLLMVLMQTPSLGHCAITFNEIEDGVFEVFVSDIKIFQHNESNPMMFIGQGRTEFVESTGNFHINNHLNTRIPLPHSMIFSQQPPIEVELYLDIYHFVRFKLYEDDQHGLVLDVTDTGGLEPPVDRLWLRLVAQEGEEVYGGGEQFSYLNLRGHAFPVWSREQGVGRNKSTMTTFLADQKDGSGGNYHTTYFPQPTFISTRGYYLHNAGAQYAVLDFTQPDFHELYVMAGSNVSSVRVLIQNGSDVAGLVGRLSEVMGRQPALPDWVHAGAILGLHGGTGKLRDHVKEAEEHGIAVAGVWIQDWAGTITTSFGQRPFWNWQWNQAHYPDLPALINELGQKGIRVLGYINPYLHQDGPLFDVAEERGYFVKNASNQTYLNDFGEFFCGTIDLTNPEAFEWYKNDVIKRNMIEFGLGGWMADFGEYLPVQGVHLYSGQSAEDLHNQWPLLWARLNREAVEEAGKLGELVFWMRAGFSGSGNYSTLMWAGHQNVDWSLSDGLPSTITAALSLAMSGLTLTHFDIGGSTTFSSFTPPLVRSEQLLLRSAEMAVFTPVFRTHEGSQPWANVQYYSSLGTLLKFARLSRMFAALRNYTRHVVAASALTGLAAQRPLFLRYPADPRSYRARFQYLYGDDLLVAPVVEPDMTLHTVYLPPDPEAPWVFLWDESMIVQGGREVTVDAPVGHPPVFYRRDSPYAPVFRAVGSEPLVLAPPQGPTVPPEGGDEGRGEVVPPSPECGTATALSKPGLVWSFFFGLVGVSVKSLWPVMEVV